MQDKALGPAPLARRGPSVAAGSRAAPPPRGTRGLPLRRQSQLKTTSRVQGQTCPWTASPADLRRVSGATPKH